MAFENVFGNVNYGMIPQARQMDAARIQQGIGQGIAQYNQEQDRELKRRQLEMAAQAAQSKGIDFKQQAQQALYNSLLSKGATPEQASMEVMKQTATATRQFNPVTEQFDVVQSGWGDIDTGFIRAMGAEPPMVNASGVPREQIRATNADVSTVPPVITKEDFYKAKGIDVPQIGAPAGALPSTQKEVAKANVDLQKTAAQNKIEASKEKREFDLAKQRNRPKEQRNLYGAVQDFKVVNDLIDKAIGQSNKWTAGIIGAGMGMLPATGAYDTKATIKSIKADKMLSRLTELKKEGGTLGALAQKEQEALENSLASLDNWQSLEQLDENLLRYKELRRNSMNKVMAAYKDDYGEVPQDIVDMFGGNTLTPEQARAELARRRGQ